MLLAEIVYFLWGHSLRDKLTLMQRVVTKALGMKIQFKLGMTLYKVTRTVAKGKTVQVGSKLDRTSVPWSGEVQQLSCKTKKRYPI